MINLQPKHPLVYPPDNYLDFERWFLSIKKPQTEREYLPILWTSYYCANGYGKKPDSLHQLQEYIDSLPDKKYYTIVQYDDGILNDLSKKDIRVYSMSGRPMDYPLPLICTPHAYPKVGHKDIFCNFIGRNTHPIRKELFSFSRLQNWYVTDRSHNLKKFCNILGRSTFTLCPRGYGPTSFRIMEALQYGSIPVYISDKFIIPHKIPFDEYGVLIRTDQIKDITKILKDIDPSTKRKDIYEQYFTYESTAKLIFDDLRLS